MSSYSELLYPELQQEMGGRVTDLKIFIQINFWLSDSLRGMYVVYFIYPKVT